MRKLLVEFIGTFFLVFAIGCTTESGSTNAALAFGSILMVMVYAGGHISGAHYNPAVSFAVFIRRRISGGEMIQYWIVQLIGGFLGAVMSYVVTGNNAAAVTHMPGAGVSTTNALLAEIIGTFALAYVVLNVATTKTNEGNSFYGLAIGFTVFALAIGLGPVSGGAFNPAVGLGRNVSEAMFGTNHTITYAWLYVVGPLLGATIAGLIFRIVSPGDMLETIEMTTDISDKL